MNRIFREHRQRNADSRERWECFATHRRQVTDLLMAPHADGQGRLCVLGAGNCNDLNLSALTEGYREVHLVDLDDEAVRDGLASQGLTDPSRVHVHGGIDLAGCNAIVSDWATDAAPSETALQHCVDTINAHSPPPVPAPFDVVASVCLLTQLVDSLALSLRADHPRFLELVTSVRLRHIRLLFEMLRPGGTAILVTDFVSSATAPVLATVSADDLPSLAAELIEARNFFTGTNPAVVHGLFQTDAMVAPRVDQLDMSRPWLWDFGPRIYAVYALSARTQASS